MTTLETKPFVLEAWHRQLDGKQEILEMARRRRESCTVVLHVDADGKVQPAKVTLRGRE